MMQNFTLSKGASSDTCRRLAPITDTGLRRQPVSPGSADPKNSEFARNTLTVVDLLQKRGWLASGYGRQCTGSPGNEQADALTKQGS